MLHSSKSFYCNRPLPYVSTSIYLAALPFVWKSEDQLPSVFFGRMLKGFWSFSFGAFYIWILEFPKLLPQTSLTIGVFQLFTQSSLFLFFYQSYFFDTRILMNGEEAPSDGCCRLCGKIGHYVRNCPRSRKSKRKNNKSKWMYVIRIIESDVKFELTL